MKNAKEIKEQACGLWAGVVACVAPQLIPAIEKKGKHCACSVHGGKDGFRVFKNFAETGGAICNTCGSFSDGLALIEWANGWNFKETLIAVNEYLNGHTQTVPPNTVKLVRKVEAPNLKHQQAIDNTLSRSEFIHNTVAETYLNNRGLVFASTPNVNNLAFIESLPYWHDDKDYGAFPAMIGIYRNLDGEVINLHRTYLNSNGMKASVPSAKKMMSPSLSGATIGCAVQLFTPTKQLAITEGIETALAVHLSTGLPVWAATSTTLLEKVQIPHMVQEVFIMADKDRSGAGERSAQKLAQRLLTERPRLIVKVCLPPLGIPEGEKSIDWLDIYQRETGFNFEPLQKLAGNL